MIIRTIQNLDSCTDCYNNIRAGVCLALSCLSKSLVQLKHEKFHVFSKGFISLLNLFGPQVSNRQLFYQWVPNVLLSLACFDTIMRQKLLKDKHIWQGRSILLSDDVMTLNNVEFDRYVLMIF